MGCWESVLTLKEVLSDVWNWTLTPRYDVSCPRLELVPFFGQCFPSESHFFLLCRFPLVLFMAVLAPLLSTLSCSPHLLGLIAGSPCSWSQRLAGQSHHGLTETKVEKQDRNTVVLAYHEASLCEGTEKSLVMRTGPLNTAFYIWLPVPSISVYLLRVS